MNNNVNPCGIISLVLGIQALVLNCFMPVAIIIAIMSIVFATIAMTRKELPKGQAIAGICCSTTVLTIWITIITISMVATEMFIEMQETLERMFF